MGVGVLIGRSSVSNAKAPAAPAQVISLTPGAVAGAAAGAASSTGAKTSTAPSTKTPAGKHAANKSSSESSASGSGTNGVGQTLNKPAPPSAAEHLRGGKGGSYEQKSKNLPNVISTG